MKGTAAALTAAIGVLALASGAQGAITTTHISTPADPSYVLYDNAAPGLQTISGTTDSSSAGGDTVDVGCLYDLRAAHATNVSLLRGPGNAGYPLASDGSF